MKKLIYFSSLLALAVCGRAFSLEDRVDATEKTKGYKQGYGVENKLSAICNAPARYMGSWEFFVTGNFLYWQVKETGLTVAETSNSSTSIPGKMTIERLHHEYKPGMRAALGFNFEKDQWVGTVNYTRFHTTQHRHVKPTAHAQKMSPLWLKYDNHNTSDSSFSYAKGKWSLKLDLVDFDLSRPFYTGRDLTINFFGGLRGGWITQHYVAKYIEETLHTTPQNRSVEKSWLLGGRGGFNGRWLIGAGFRFFSDVAINLFYQKMTVHVKEEDTTNPDVLYLNEKSRNGLITPNIDCIMGLGYGTYFGDKKWHFDISLGYELQAIFNQNYMREENNKLNAAGTFRGYVKETGTTLGLHGITAACRLDF